MRKIGRAATHLFTAAGMLAVLLIVVFIAAQQGQKLPVVGGAFGWVGSHASGSAEGF